MTNTNHPPSCSHLSAAEKKGEKGEGLNPITDVAAAFIVAIIHRFAAITTHSLYRHHQYHQQRSPTFTTSNYYLT
jgi:hypothetical protein